MANPSSPVLSESQLQTLREVGEERTAEVGETLFDVGDQRYPFIAIIEGEAAVQDRAGNEIVRHGAGGFLGEVNLLSGQTVFLRAVVTEPMRHIAVQREKLRPLLTEDGSLADLLLSTFIRRREALQQFEGIGLEVVGPRSSAENAADRRLRQALAPPASVARPRALRRPRAEGPGRCASRGGSAARPPAWWDGAARSQQR